MKKQILGRLEYCIEELKTNIRSLEAEYMKLEYGTVAFDTTLKIERLKGELSALEYTKLYIEHNISIDK